MSNFRIAFTVSPWLLLLIIPALAIVISMFFIHKHTHLTLNRLLSTVLQAIVLVLCVFVMSGMYFTYDLENVNNELVILVDNSFTTQNVQNPINDFIHDVLIENDDLAKVSIVTFGYDQKVILEMGNHDPEEAFESYRIYSVDGPPDNTATDIAAALQFVWDPNTKKSDIISKPETAKILLISDGLQTDQEALNVAKRLSMDGISIDTTFFSAGTVDDASIVEVAFPERNLMIGEEFNIQVTLRSTYQGLVNIILEDKNENGIVTTRTRENLILNIGLQTFTMPHAFNDPGFHEIMFRIQTSDKLAENNIFYSYYDIAGYNRILIIEKYKGESNELLKLIESRPDSDYLFVATAQIDDDMAMPGSLDIMAQYNQIILYNIASSDMSDDFQQNLYTYVNNLGGGLFTVGGFEKTSSGAVQSVEIGGKRVPMQHSYSEEDLQGSLYEEMLPVSVEPYTPPLGVVFVIDTSGSMTDPVHYLLNDEVDAALACLDVFDQQDYVGIVTMEDDSRANLGMTPMTQRSRITTALAKIAASGSTMDGKENYTPAINEAGRMLNALEGVERKHIVFISDCGTIDGYESYVNAMENLNKRFGITITVVTILADTGSGLPSKGAMGYDRMEWLAEAGGGSEILLLEGRAAQCVPVVQKDLKFDELQGVQVADYNPTLGTNTPIVEGINDRMLQSIELKGVFTSRVKGYGDVKVSLMAKYVPLYAQWEFGKGRVGSLMIDLEGIWSQKMLSEATGKKILSNIVTELLMPVNAQEQTLEITLIEDNYRTQVNVHGFDFEEEPNSKLVAIVQPPVSSGEAAAKFDLSTLSLRGNRFTFENLHAGVYNVYVIKVSRDLDIMSESIRSVADIPGSAILEMVQIYRSFSYSKEYDQSLDPYTTGQELLENLSTRKMTEDSVESKIVYEAKQVFEDFRLSHIDTYPRLVFMILCIVLFLADIALRKFKVRRLKEVMEARRYKKSLKA